MRRCRRRRRRRRRAGRRDHVDDAVRGFAGVPSTASRRTVERAGVVERVLGGDQSGLERRRAGDRLERRAGRVAGLDRAVEQRVLLVVGQALDRVVETGGVKTLGSKVGAEPIPRIEPSSDVHRDERARQAAARRAPTRRLAWTFSSRVSFRLSPASGSIRDSSRPLGLPDASTWTRIAPLRPRRIGSYCASRPGGADPVARLEALVGRLLELVGADLADVAEQVRAERAVRVFADVDLRWR